jgi:hypothetical protein
MYLVAETLGGNDSDLITDTLVLPSISNLSFIIFVGNIYGLEIEGELGVVPPARILSVTQSSRRCLEWKIHTQ